MLNVTLFVCLIKECTDGLLDQLDQQLKTVDDECKDYR
jgi:beclin